VSDLIGLRGLTEAEFQAHVVEVARMLHWRVAHFRPAMTRHGWRTPVQGDKGFPDLVLVRGPGWGRTAPRVIFAELKSETGRVTPEQHDWLVELEAAGAEVYVWQPSDLQAIAETLR
jgi:hypothetical protein